MLDSLLLGALLAASPLPDPPPSDPSDALLGLSLEQLGDVQVTATSRRASRLADTPASVYVIDGETIRALGIRSLPEALRLAPNLQVARINAAGYAVSARGMKTSLSNKMLVMVDGRPIYTPLFAGVLWDMQDVPMADIDRIEVVSGPGAAAWGANAVNGVINIVTRPVKELAGGHVDLWTGAEGRGAEVAQTLVDGEAGGLRLYARRREVDATRDATGGDIPDAWLQSQAGFRGDWASGANTLRLQGDAFRAHATTRPFGALRATGANLTGHWTHEVSATSQWSVQAYYDVVHRNDPQVIDDRMAIADLELVHSFEAGSHHLSWGAGYRQARDDSRRGLLARLQPDSRTLEWAHVFAQDEIALTPRLAADLGVRLDSNRYTGVEVLPTARLAYTGERSLVWGALSRAVRSPARFDRDFYFPATEPFFIRGGPDFESETADVAEIGLRLQPTDRVSFSVTGFHHRFDNLRGGTPAPQGGLYIANAAKARLWGIEAWATARVAGRWELAGGWLEMRQQRDLKDGFSGAGTLADQGNDPDRQLVMRATRRLGEHQQLSMSARHVGALPAPAVPAYTQVDARWSWRPISQFELGVGAQNLFDQRHAELQPANGLPQSVFGRAAFVDLRVDW